MVKLNGPTPVKCTCSVCFSINIQISVTVHRGCYTSFNKDYEALSNYLQYYTLCGNINIGVEMTRWHCLPFVEVDFNRVVLKDGDPKVLGTDYINANLIQVSITVFHTPRSVWMRMFFGRVAPVVYWYDININLWLF